MRLTLLTILVCLLSLPALAVPPWDARSITRAINEGNWQVCEAFYRQLQESELDAEQQALVDYNLALSLYHQERYEEALPLFESVSGNKSDPSLATKALYNLGNTLFRLERLEPAKEAFEKALLANPDDDDARHNIEVILDQQQDQSSDSGDSDDDSDESDNDDQQGDPGDPGDQGEGDQGEGDQSEGDNQQGDSQDQDGSADSQDADGNTEPADSEPAEGKEMSEAEKKKAQEEAERARLFDYFHQQDRERRPPMQFEPQPPPVRGKTW